MVNQNNFNFPYICVYKISKEPKIFTLLSYAANGVSEWVSERQTDDKTLKNQHETWHGNIENILEFSNFLEMEVPFYPTLNWIWEEINKKNVIVANIFIIKFFSKIS